MVNTGLPSRDCETCRQRRVKCDLRRPFCRRCEKIGRVCSGYRDLSKPTLTFRVQTPSTFSTRKKHGRKDAEIVDVNYQSVSKTNPSILPATQDDDPQNIVMSSEQASFQPLSMVSQPWGSHILPFIIHNFSFPSPSGGRFRGSLECVPNLLYNIDPNSALHLVCQAVGYVYHANQTNSRKSTVTHRQMYGNALRALQDDINDVEKQKEDSILLAVWLACLYELMLGDASCDPSEGPLNWDIHSRALGQLLKLRGSQQFKTKTGCQLFQLTYHNIQIQSLSAIADPAPEARGWFDSLQSSARTDELSFIPSFFYGDEVARSCREGRLFYANAITTSERLAAIDFIVHECDRLEASLDRSSKVCSPSERGVSTSQSANPTNITERGKLRLRNHVDVCLLRVRSITLELLLDMLDLPDLSDESLDHLLLLQGSMIFEAQTRAARILSTLPSFLPEGEAQAPSWAESLRMMWPLRMIIRSSATDNEAKQTATLALRRIAYQVGLMQAVRSFYPALSDV
ncbi:hypothetical protein N7488_010803 [Penicillium malachiteum]|nr:hypothetical protein N7488_010803 [Penicillium malachiteum]